MTRRGRGSPRRSTRERETTVPTTLRPPSIPAARADVVDLVREMLARLPASDWAGSPSGSPVLTLASRPVEARRRLSDEVPTKDDDEEEEEGDLDDEDDDVIVDEEEEDEEEDEDDWDEDDDDDEDDWDEDDEDDDDWDDEDDDDDWDDEDDDDDEDEDDEEDQGETPAVRLTPPARRRR